MTAGLTGPSGAGGRGWAGGLRPVHPPLVHAPIGGVIVAAVCDVVSLVGGDGHAWSRTWFKGGSYALIVGTAILFAAVATGVVERNRRTRPASAQRSVVDRHAVVMSLMGAVCVGDLILRNGHYSAARHTPVVVLVLTLVALVLTVVGGELGGRLVYRLGIAAAPPAAQGLASQAPAVGEAPSSHAGEHR